VDDYEENVEEKEEEDEEDKEDEAEEEDDDDDEKCTQNRGRKRRECTHAELNNTERPTLSVDMATTANGLLILFRCSIV